MSRMLPVLVSLKTLKLCGEQKGDKPLNFSPVSFALLVFLASADSMSQSDGLYKLHMQFLQRLDAAGVTMSSTALPPHHAPSTGGESTFSTIVRTKDAEAVKRLGLDVNSVLPELLTCHVTKEQMLQLASLPSVSFIEPGAIHRPSLEVSIPEIGALLLHAGFVNATPYKGQGVIVVIYDTGIDWKHLDFRKADTTRSRILAIWDQTLNGKRPVGFSYGTEYTQAEIEDELDGSPEGVVVSDDVAGHGTHVASIAAGNGLSHGGKYTGVAPESDIIVIKGGDSFFFEDAMIDGLSYAAAKGALYGKPVVVNLSLGSQFGPRNGTNPMEIAIENFVSVAGRVVCISAGNEGGENIHVRRTLDPLQNATIEFILPTYQGTPETGTNFFLFDVWFDDAASVVATLTSPSGEWLTKVNGTYGQIGTGDGAMVLWNLPDWSTGRTFITAHAYNSGPNELASGTWKLELSTQSDTTSFHAWLPAYSIGHKKITISGADADYTVSMPGTSNGGITVGSYITRWSWPSYDGGFWSYGPSDRTGDLSLFSGRGPTSDERLKPDMTAPGQGIGPALSSLADTSFFGAEILPGLQYVINQGTSMAAPHVTGIVALLLQANPTLMASEIKLLLGSAARTDTYTSIVPNSSWGWGKLDALRAMSSLLNAGSGARTILAYDQQSTDVIHSLTGAKKVAVRFSPSQSGILSGIHLVLPAVPIGSFSGTGEILCEVYDSEVEDEGNAANYGGSGKSNQHQQCW